MGPYEYQGGIALTYSVTYDGNGNTGGTVPVDNTNYLTSDMVTVLGNTGSLEKTSYTFAGWNTAADGSGTTYNADDSFDMGTANVTLYAQWTALPTYTVTFSVVGDNGTLAAAVDGTGINSGAEVVEGKEVLFTATPDSGYQVKEWTLNTVAVADNTSSSYTAPSLAGDITVTVEFELIPPTIYTVTFDGNGGTPATTTEQVEEGSTITILPTVTRDDYTFEGWNTSSDGSGTAFTTATVVTGNLTVYAQWEEIPPVPQFAGGAGTAEEPWEIATAAQLNNVRYHLDKHFKLVDNIDLDISPYNEGAGWQPIGDIGDPFTGNFEGNGKTITGLYINDDSLEDAGLFGPLFDGSIRNLALTNVDIFGGDFVGGLASWQGGGSISNVSVTGVVSGNNCAGGLIGQFSSGSIANTWAAVQVGDSILAGGLIGYGDSATVISSYYNSEIAGQTDDTGKGEPRTTADMTYPYNADTTYIGWDFDYVWDIQEGVNSGYPFLRDPSTTNPPMNYSVTFSVEGDNGRLDAEVDSTAISSGAEVEESKDVVFTATPDAGYRVKEWKLDTTVVVGNTSTTYTVTDLATDIIVTVEFEAIPPAIYTVTFNGNGGTPATTDIQAAEGSTITTLPTVTRDGYTFTSWNTAANGSETAFATTTVVTGDITVYAQWEANPPVSGYIVAVSANPAEGGTVTGGGNYETGDRVKVSATANENYVFINWTEGSTVVTKGETYNFKMGTENRSLVANFEAKEPTTEPTTEWLVIVSARPSGGGTVSGGGMFEEGDLVEVIATANDGYWFINWTEGLTEVSTNAVYSFTMGTAERSLTANFLVEGSGWPKIVRLTTGDITATSVTLILNQPVPDATMYLVYSDDGSCKTFDASSYASMLIDELEPATFYTFTVQALYSDGSETSDGPSVKVKTKK